MNKFYQKLFKNTFSTILTVVIASLAVVGFVYAATTVGDNVSVGGTLGVTGVSTFSWATSTSATSTAYLYIGPDITEPTAGWDFSGGDLLVADDAFIGDKATATTAFWVGAGGTANNVNLTGGDLYVQDSAEIDGGLWANAATTTDTLSVGGKATTTGNTVIGSKTLTAGATTTITFGSNAKTAGTGTCLKFFSAGITIWCYFDTARLSTAPTSTALICDTDNTGCE